MAKEVKQEPKQQEVTQRIIKQRHRKTVDEKLSALNAKKASATEKLNALKTNIAKIDKEIAELTKQKQDEEVGELYKFMLSKNITVEDVKKKFS